MFKLADLFTKKLVKSSTEKPSNTSVKNSSTSIKNSVATSTGPLKNWYEEKFDKLIVQRNILLIFSIILLLLTITAVVAVTIVTNLRKFDPFVIQIDESTGIAKVVNPINSEMLDGNEALAKYFVKKYVIARETYNAVDFETLARNTIRLYSTNSVFRNYLGYIRNPAIDPLIKYGQKNSSFLIVKSWTKLDKKRYMLRFSINETAESQRVFNKIAVIDFDYVPMELQEEERDINPVGFQVNGYRSDDDNS